ncbi:MAG: hybrid sensor histidine kinase/response regulator [Proteobacteria bacterium]|nr:response regulator [Desulfocapsa sp.]MBU3945047.1 hybrid sensor histidine kinase/response regulator [Pseudomonadota bacterium]MBU4029977.1 hybrid sensor histidine kinase/response regulator [Pseudomonadota bacterium]MBU4043337.1 hybrid sensor histidine kinase/response regulator [Pseudomonadota bacterium]MBU4085134.1 hybrid sensor histidine kinase/response regulator [Pseudomonadota bacterium]
MDNDNNLAPQKTPASDERPRILIVDDAPDNLGVLLDALKDDYTVIAARNGSKALQLAAATPAPDLILLDIVMPEMDGYQVCSRLKEREDTRSIPVIFLTALEEVESENLGLSLGAVDFIRKPINPTTLHLRVKLHIELLQSRRRLEELNHQLIEAARLRELVEQITHHDLKGPLNVIIGIPQLLLRKCEFTDSQRNLVKTIRKTGYNMLEMINRSLNLFKMERDSYDYRPEPVDILSVMRCALDEMRPLVTARNIQVALRVDNQLPRDGQKVMVMAESLFCHSMFSNLIKNAVEASPHDDVINIGFEQRRADVMISIDNGGEVPEEIRERFFDKFVTAGKRDGTGLGTYSAKLIAQTQRGTIDLDTLVAGRTCIRVTMPAGNESECDLTAA